MKKAFTMVIYKFLVRYQVFQNVICKYNCLLIKTQGLNMNKINTQIIWNNQIRKAKINGLFITILNHCLLFQFYFFLYSYLLLSSLILLLYTLLWSNGLVVKALDSQSRGLMFKTTGWLKGQFSLSSFRGW